MLTAIALFHTNKDTPYTNTATYTHDRFTSPVHDKHHYGVYHDGNKNQIV